MFTGLDLSNYFNPPGHCGIKRASHRGCGPFYGAGSPGRVKNTHTYQHLCQGADLRVQNLHTETGVHTSTLSAMISTMRLETLAFDIIGNASFERYFGFIELNHGGALGGAGGDV